MLGVNGMTLNFKVTLYRAGFLLTPSKTSLDAVIHQEMAVIFKDATLFSAHILPCVTISQKESELGKAKSIPIQKFKKQSCFVVEEGSGFSESKKENVIDINSFYLFSP